MREYRIRLKSDTGSRIVRTSAESEHKAILLVLKAENAPRRAVLSCAPVVGASKQFGVEAGRVITKDGAAYVSVSRRPDPSEGAGACDADRLAHRIAYLLNKYGEHGPAPSYLDGSY